MFLPGRGDRVGVYRREKFAPMLAEHGIRAEAVEVDLHLGYYARRLVHMRLHEDVVAPARSRGVREIWLVGVSMGGLGTVIYDRYHPGQANGLVLLAPYLGEEKVTDEITAAGGVTSWAPALPLGSDDWQREVWWWLKTRTSPGQPHSTLVLGYGREDAFAPSSKLLADVLPRERVFTAPGGHDWSVWRELWKNMLASGQVGSECR